MSETLLLKINFFFADSLTLVNFFIQICTCPCHTFDDFDSLIKFENTFYIKTSRFSFSFHSRCFLERGARVNNWFCVPRLRLITELYEIRDTWPVRPHLCGGTTCFFFSFRSLLKHKCGNMRWWRVTCAIVFVST